MWQFDGTTWTYSTSAIRASIQPLPAGDGWMLAIARDGRTTCTDHPTVQEAQAQAQPLIDLYARYEQEETDYV